MHIFDSAVAIAAASTDTSLDTTVHDLLAERVRDWADAGLMDLTCVIILERGDTEQSLRNETGLMLLTNPLDGRRFGSEGFVPPLDWLSDLGGHFELIQTVGNDGFAFHIFVPDREGVNPELLALCRAYANGGE